MTDPYKMPPLQSPFVDGSGKITQPWAGLLRDYLVALKAERAPGRVQPFWLSAADVADATKFIQAGADEGKGINDYLGWAKCDGNDGRPTADEVFLRWGLAGHDAAGASGGSDSSAHTHDRGAHSHSLAGDAGYACIGLAADAGATVIRLKKSAKVFAATQNASAVTAAADTNNNYGVQLGGLTASDGAGNTGAASATDNRPAFYSWVPLLRV